MRRWMILLAVLASVTVTGSAQGRGGSRVRSVRAIERAIERSWPAVRSAVRRHQLALVVHEVAAPNGVHPFTVVALAGHESHGRERVENHLHCIGLMQVCAAQYKACRQGYDTPSCIAKREQLKDGAYNIRQGVAAILAWRKWCSRKYRGRTGWGWLVGYGGFGSRCGVTRKRRRVYPESVRDVIAAYRRLNRTIR